VSVVALPPANTGAVGATVSMVTDRRPEAALTFPAGSVAVAEMPCTPLPSCELTMLQLLLAAAIALPSSVAPSNSFTVLPASAVPVNVGAVMLVMLSVAETPLSINAASFGTVGAAGAVVSIVTTSDAEAALTLPATVCFAVRVWAPAPSATLVIVQLPEESAVVVPSTWCHWC
jgi:hypothetical protein